jgi:hypothetical protein
VLPDEGAAAARQLVADIGSTSAVRIRGAAIHLTALALSLAAQPLARAGSAGAEKSGSAGIAAQYVGDVGIERDARVVFVEDFEKRGPGSFKGHWSTEGNKAQALSIDSIAPEGSRGRRSLKVTAKRGRNAGGYLYKVFGPGYDVLHARMYVRFDPAYGFSHHFCSLGGKLDPPPWPMGGAGKRPKLGFGTGIEPCRALLHTYPPERYGPPGFWHFYTYWPEMHSWQTIEGRSDGRPNAYYGNNFSPREPSVIERGKWICVEWMVKLNSHPTKRDGEQRFWIDGKLVGEWAVWFDHVVVATGYIGPIAAARRPEKTHAPSPQTAVDGEKVLREAAARRMLTAARMAERMGQRDAARGLFRKIIDEYPDTEAAGTARRQLE